MMGIAKKRARRPSSDTKHYKEHNSNPPTDTPHLESTDSNCPFRGLEVPCAASHDQAQLRAGKVGTAKERRPGRRATASTV